MHTFSYLVVILQLLHKLHDPLTLHYRVVIDHYIPAFGPDTLDVRAFKIIFMLHNA